MAPPETPRRADAPAVVGRELERARIDGFREDIADGPRMLILHGAQGVGRSTLWWYGVERSRAHGIQVLLTRPVAEEIPLALVGVDDLLRHADAAAPDGADDVLAHGRALLETLRRLAVDAPVLLAIDDVQWLDPASVARCASPCAASTASAWASSRPPATPTIRYRSHTTSAGRSTR